MNAENLEAFEQQAAELVALAKGLLREFEGRLGEALHAQRLAVSEARAEGVKVTQQLQDLGHSAKTIVDQHRDLLARIERDWQLRIDSNAERAGRAQAQAFGQGIAAGLADRLEQLAARVQATTRRFIWSSALRWGLAVGVGIALTVAAGVWALIPEVDGLSQSQVRASMTRLRPCQIHKEQHVCIAVDEKPEVTKGAGGEILVVVRGM